MAKKAKRDWVWAVHNPKDWAENAIWQCDIVPEDKAVKWKPLSARDRKKLGHYLRAGSNRTSRLRRKHDKAMAMAIVLVLTPQRILELKNRWLS